MSSNQPERKTDMSELDEVLGLLKHLRFLFKCCTHMRLMTLREVFLIFHLNSSMWKCPYKGLSTVIIALYYLKKKKKKKGIQKFALHRAV